jgi:FdhD protein
MSNNDNTLGMSEEYDVVRYKHGVIEQGHATVATEVPVTLFVNDSEIATLACSPGNLREFGFGFLFTAGFINSIGDVRSCTIDKKRWVLEIEITNPPDPQMLTKRLFTSGCGRGVMFSSLTEMAQRRPLINSSCIKPETISNLMRWLQSCSSLHKSSGGVHSAALSVSGTIPTIFYDDIGRHNAVDKVIGAGLLNTVPFADSILCISGRISSEILFKARRSEIPIVVSLGSVTHQTVLLAQSMELTVIGYARGNSFTVYSKPDRVIS